MATSEARARDAAAIAVSAAQNDPLSQGSAWLQHEALGYRPIYTSGLALPTSLVWRAEGDFRWTILHPVFLGGRASWEDRRSLDGFGGVDYEALELGLYLEIAI